MCQEMPSECKTCDTNACNSEDFQPKTELRCYSCSSGTEGDCMFLQEEGSNEENCIDEHCFTFSNETHFMRGCLSDFLASPDLCRDNCVYCQTDNCNSAQLMEQVCYSCDSTIDENCILNPNATEQTTCDQSVAQHSGCYHHERGNE